MTLDSALSVANIGLASVLVALMALRRVFRPSPVFFAYVCFDLVFTAAALAIYLRSGPSAWYLYVFLFAFAGDLLLYFWVLAELGKNLLRFNRESRPHWQLAVLFFTVTAVLIGALARWAATPGRSLLGNVCFLLMRADGALEFAGFLALILWSSLRKLRWHERELRIATGLGFTSFVWFLISLLQFQWSTGPVYFWLYQAGQAADLMTLAYWLHYFWIADQGSLAHNDDAGRENRRGREDSEHAQCSAAATRLAVHEADAVLTPLTVPRCNKKQW
jgi:hypothetical protein